MCLLYLYFLFFFCICIFKSCKIRRPGIVRFPASLEKLKGLATAEPHSHSHAWQQGRSWETLVAQVKHPSTSWPQSPPSSYSSFILPVHPSSAAFTPSSSLQWVTFEITLDSDVCLLINLSTCQDWVLQSREKTNTSQPLCMETALYRHH